MRRERTCRIWKWINRQSGLLIYRRLSKEGPSIDSLAFEAGSAKVYGKEPRAALGEKKSRC